MQSVGTDRYWVNKMIKVGIIGGTGYIGVELLRLLASHPEVSLSVIISPMAEGMPVAQMYLNLRGFYNLAFLLPVIRDCRNVM